MPITGELLIGSSRVQGRDGAIRAINPSTGAELEPTFRGADSADVAQACTLAASAFDPFRSAPLETRAQLLEAIAQGILDLGDELIERVMAESGLPRPRMEGERARTVGQLRLFATIVRDGRWLNVTIDPALPDRKPAPRPISAPARSPSAPLPSSAPAISPSPSPSPAETPPQPSPPDAPSSRSPTPPTSAPLNSVGTVIQKAVAALNLPEGIFSLLTGSGRTVGEALVRHPAHSVRGLHRISRRRPRSPRHRAVPPRPHSRLRRDEQHQSALPPARRPRASAAQPSPPSSSPPQPSA